jgi:hypothetical protein
MKFKIGDKVRVIKGGYGIHPRYEGITTIIIDVDHFNRKKYKVIDFGWACEESFELVEPVKRIIKQYGIVNFINSITKREVCDV